LKQGKNEEKNYFKPYQFYQKKEHTLEKRGTKHFN